MDLKTPLSHVGKTYKIAAKKLEKLNIFTIEDLLYHIPFRYENYTIVSRIGMVQNGEQVTIQGIIEETKNEYTRSRLKIQKVIVADETGRIECVWFNQPFILNTLRVGMKVSIAGKVNGIGRRLSIQVKDYEVIEEGKPLLHTAGLVPIYPETRGLSSKWIRNRVYDLLENYKENLTEFLPDHILQKHELLNIQEALSEIHFPNSSDASQKARQRLSFDELFLAQLTGLVRRIEWNKKKVTNPLTIHPHKDKLHSFVASLPFQLTSSQKNAVEEIFSDLEKEEPMNRLLEGDVGSGKTVVAAIAMYATHLNGMQSVLMAPTEILANQHYETINKFLFPLGIKVGLATGGGKYVISDVVYDRKALHTKYEIHNTDIMVGTHALLNSDIEFKKLGLVVIDEQQRFGVEQRSILREKGVSPHFLTMTATPIPRTVFLTLFGDLKMSLLSEMPYGRKAVKTWLVPESKRENSYEWIKKQIDVRDVQGESLNQVFLVCPFIEESETMSTVKAATAEFERLKKGPFKNYRLALLHGKIKGKDKQQILNDFHNQKIDMLVATPVVEVGIDIPNATIIIIEASERFGLAQLHQLRGRVGRNDRQSYCLLFTDSQSEKTIQRLKYLETTNNGAQLAELDLKLRGPGDMFGTMQHGSAELKIASLSDFELIEKTRQEATLIFPAIEHYPTLIQKVKQYDNRSISPD